MMTMQKVLDVFRDYLEQDKQAEIVSTSRGYTFLLWDSVQEEWFENKFCKTPKVMMDVLLGSYACYEEYLITRGIRNLTDDEKALIDQRRNALKERCEQD